MPTTATTSLRRPINRTILHQHAEEAAFCWLRRQESRWRPSYRCSHLQRLDQLLDAHLEGLRIAAQAALPIVLDNVQRWKTADEVFACTYTLLHCSAADWSPLERVLEAQPDTVKGAAAALIWSAGPPAEDRLQRWGGSAIPALRVASAGAYAALHSNDSTDARTAWLAKTLVDPAPEVRACALRRIGEWRLSALTAHLQKAFTEPDALCRFESACAMAWLGMPQADAALLDTLPRVQGNRQRRGTLLFAMTAQPAAFATWVQQAQVDPTQTRALVWSLAFRGDALALSKLLEYLRVPQYARLAGYAIGHISGLDLDKQGLWQPEQQAEVTPHFSEDDGLLMPDIERLTDWVERYVTSMPMGTSLLAGKVLSTDNARRLLQTGWQPQRWQASVLLDREDRRQGFLSQVPSPQLFATSCN